MALFPARSIVSKSRIPTAMVFLAPYDEGEVPGEALYNMGNIKDATFNPEIEEWEDWSVQHGVRELIGTYPIQKGGTFTLSSTSWTELLFRLMYVAKPGYLNQDASANTTVTFEGLKAGDIRQVPHRNAALVSADDGEDIDPVEWVEGTNFTFHSHSGILEILSVPLGADKLELTLDVPAVTDADKQPKLDLMSSQGIICKVICVGTNEMGVQGEMVLNKVKFMPSGGMSETSEGNEGATGALTGRVYRGADGKFATWQAYSKV